MHKNNCSLGVVYGKEIIAEIKNIKEMVNSTRQEISEVVHSENEKRKMIRENTQEIISEIEKQKNEKIKQIEIEAKERNEKLKELNAQLEIALKNNDKEEISRIMKQLY